MSDALLETRGLVKKYGGVLATDKVDFLVREREVHAVIGPNGAGKTTLLAQLSGQLQPTAGTILFKGIDITRKPCHARSLLGISRSFQITSLCKEFTALENVTLAWKAKNCRPYHVWRSFEDDEGSVGALNILEVVGLREKFDVTSGDLAHGEQRQLELAIALATSPKVLLLDEPSAGLGRAETAAMRNLLLKLKQVYSIVLIEHDMDVVFQLADRISVLVYGRCIVSGRPEDVRADRRVREAYLGTSD
jgi:branched-chain amino acid transport system ATP-binding protein